MSEESKNESAAAAAPSEDAEDESSDPLLPRTKRRAGNANNIETDEELLTEFYGDGIFNDSDLQRPDIVDVPVPQALEAAEIAVGEISVLAAPQPDDSEAAAEQAADSAAEVIDEGESAAPVVAGGEEEAAMRACTCAGGHHLSRPHVLDALLQFRAVFGVSLGKSKLPDDKYSSISSYLTWQKSFPTLATSKKRKHPDAAAAGAGDAGEAGDPWEVWAAKKVTYHAPWDQSVQLCRGTVAFMFGIGPKRLTSMIHFLSSASAAATTKNPDGRGHNLPERLLGHDPNILKLFESFCSHYLSVWALELPSPSMAPRKGVTHTLPARHTITHIHAVFNKMWAKLQEPDSGALPTTVCMCDSDFTLSHTLIHSQVSIMMDSCRCATTTTLFRRARTAALTA